MSKEAMKLALRIALEDLDATESLGPTTEAVIDAAQQWYLAEQPAQQEPVAWISKHGVVYPLDAKDEVHPINELQPLYTAPPAQRTWVGLTGEEKAELDAEHGDDTLAHLDAIEAKLKEKNT